MLLSRIQSEIHKATICAQSYTISFTLFSGSKELSIFSLCKYFYGRLLKTFEQCRAFHIAFPTLTSFTKAASKIKLFYPIRRHDAESTLKISTGNFLSKDLMISQDVYKVLFCCFQFTLNEH